MYFSEDGELEGFFKAFKVIIGELHSFNVKFGRVVVG
jgi:hypothetical protein